MVVVSEPIPWRVSSVVSVCSGISFQLVKLPITVGSTAPLQKSIQSLFLGCFVLVACVFAQPPCHISLRQAERGHNMGGSVCCALVVRW